MDGNASWKSCAFRVICSYGGTAAGPSGHSTVVNASTK